MQLLLDLANSDLKEIVSAIKDSLKRENGKRKTENFITDFLKSSKIVFDKAENGNVISIIYDNFKYVLYGQNVNINTISKILQHSKRILDDFDNNAR